MLPSINRKTYLETSIFDPTEKTLYIHDITNRQHATQKRLDSYRARVNNPFPNTTDVLLMLLYENFMSA